ncbi:AEC family transporter [Neomegalonema sp.]|uniref:AEC family transporter n=1 Tax=Neomegalonema sp. TaxID=2039713 RepID=UPI00260C49FA|nr:AEC family transporter [Neomegalonema sp.]MDD2868607.1 AEC family transporter [Neomegalonema sp.]
MTEVLIVVAPIFALLAGGWLAVKTGFFPASGLDFLLSFVNRVASPALLFTGAANLEFGVAFDPRVVGAFYLGAVTSFAVGMTMGRKAFGMTPGEAAAFAFACTFSNSLFIGYPVSVRAFGPEAEGPAFAIIGLHAPLLYLVGTLVMETSRRDGKGALAAVREVGLGLWRNPLIWGVALGLIVNLLNLPVPSPIMEGARMLGEASPAVGLFGVGGALAQSRLRGSLKPAFTAALTKTMLHPLLVLGLALAFRAPPDLAKVAVVVAASPGGLNIYLFATLFKRGQDVAAATLLVGTLLGALTIPVWLLIARAAF